MHYKFVIVGSIFTKYFVLTQRIVNYLCVNRGARNRTPNQIPAHRPENLEFRKLLHWLFWPVFPTPFHIGVNRQRINLYEGKTREKQITRGPEEISTIGILSSQQVTILYVFTRISGDKNDVDTALTKVT